MDERILVVDDDKSLLKTIENLLGKEGFTVTTTDSSYDALDKITAEFFDLVILDVRMPGMDGITLLKKIREIQEGGESSRIIIITGFASEETPVQALKLGADDYIMKPFELDDFLHSVNNNIKISRLEKDKKKYVDKLEMLHEKDKELEGKIRELIKGYETGVD